MSWCSEMMEEYLQCGKDIAYAIIYLLAVLNLKDTTQVVDHGKMTAVIRHTSSYIVKGCRPFILSFVLDNDAVLRSIFEIHCFFGDGCCC